MFLILSMFLVSILDEEEETAGCFAIIVLQMYCYYKCYVALPLWSWVGLQCVIVVFPDHTRLLFSNLCLIAIKNN